MNMSLSEVTISIESEILKRVDRLVELRVLTSRSQFMQMSIEERLAKIVHDRLAHECAKLDRAEEQSFADIGFTKEAASRIQY
jgi:metal-responsive CopG/Arc/MetJ family transcriptional regulator